MNVKAISYFSLFSGIGGFELGLSRASLCSQRPDAKPESTVAHSSVRLRQRQALPEVPRHEQRRRPAVEAGPSFLPSDIRERRPVRCVGFSEVDKYASQLYRRHFPDHRAYGDVTAINAANLPNFDLLLGGFPCQAFSLAGKRLGFDDTRGTLFFEVARFARAKRPRLLFLENVKGLLSHNGGNTFQIIIFTLDELGYDVQWQVLNSKDFGVAQNRERVFIVGHLRGTPRPQVFPFAQSCDQAIARIQADVSGKGYASQQDRTYQPSGLMGCLPTTHSGSKVLVGHKRIRRLTPVECERLQGFPDGWTEGVSDTQRYKCLGNAVTVNVIEAIASRLLAAK